METWSLLRPDLCVHVYVKSESLPNVWAQGWINYMDVLPLCDDGSSPPQPAVADYAMQRAIQVSSPSPCIASASSIDSPPSSPN